MKKYVLLLALPAVAILMTVEARAQAAASYGAAASSSATATSTVGKRLSTAMGTTLSRVAPPAPAVREDQMKVNRQKLEAKATGRPATLKVESTTPKALVTVDGLAVSYTPAELKLAAGTHQVRVTTPDSQPWERSVTVKAGESVPLKATLESKYKSQISFGSTK